MSEPMDTSAAPASTAVNPPTPAEASASAATATAASSVATPSSSVPASSSSSDSKKAEGKARGGQDRNQNFKKQRRDAWVPRNQDSQRPPKEPSSNADSKDDDDEDGGAGGGAGKKRKVALAVMYRGTNYYGLQLQNGEASEGKPTIERALMDAIYAAGGISDDNMNDTLKIKWMRAARTDKGVHAAGNVMSLMLIPDGAPPAACKSQSADIIERINAHLPEDVRTIAYTRTLGGFHAKYACTSRVYEYIIPSFVFDDAAETIALLHVSEEEQRAQAEAAAERKERSPKKPFEYSERLLNYRLSADKIASLKKIMSCFIGTHNYQNFTRKKSGFLKDQAKDRIRFAEGRTDRNNNNNGGGKKSKGEEASEDEGEGLNDQEEDMLERQAFIARRQQQDASQATSSAAPEAEGSSSSLVSPSPFHTPSRLTTDQSRRPHNPLLTNLKSTNSRDPAAQTNKVSGQYARFIRYIMEFDIESTYQYSFTSTDGKPQSMEFVRFRIHGQSFMLNQIRKMMGLLIIVARGQLPLTYLTEKAFKFDEYSIPTAPSLGLLLQRPVYETYDKKVEKIPERAMISELFLSPANKGRVDAFREQWIYKQIGDAESTSASAVDWCSRLHNNPAVIQHEEDEKYKALESETDASAAATAAPALAEGAAPAQTEITTTESKN